MKIVEKPGQAWERICLYGPPKVGKTTLATALPWGSYWGERAIYVAYDAGVKNGASEDEISSASASALKSVLEHNREHLVNVVPTGDPNWLEEAHAIATTDWRKSYPDARTLIVDPITEWTRRLLRYYADTGVFQSGHSFQFGKRDTGSWHTSPDKGEYGAVQNSLAFLTESLWKQPMHLIVVFHDDSVGDSDGMIGGPQTVGKSAIKWVPAKYDSVLYMQRQQVSQDKAVVVVNTSQRGIWRAGVRTGKSSALPPQVPLARNPVEFWKQLVGHES